MTDEQKTEGEKADKILDVLGVQRRADRRFYTAVGLFAGAVLGYTFGFWIGNGWESQKVIRQYPARVYSFDANQDGREDIIIVNGSGDRNIFIGDGETYIPFLQHLDSKYELRDGNFNAEVKRVNDIVDSFLKDEGK